MNKSELIQSIAEKSGLTKGDAGKALDATLESIMDSLANGDQVTLIGFGTFAVAERAAREGRNPQTGKITQIAASRAAKFKPGKVLKDKLN